MVMPIPIGIYLEFVNRIMKDSDKVIAIYSKYFNNIKRRPPYHEKFDLKIRRENQIRRSDILKQRKIERNHESVKNDIETLLNSIKEDLSPYKEKLMNIMNIDMFDDDIAKAFIDFKHDYNVLKEKLNYYLESDSIYGYGIRDRAKDLKLKYLRLIELNKKEN